jgi:hypothetical protein
MSTTLTVLNTATVSDVSLGGDSTSAYVYPVSIGLPSAFDGTLFYIEVKYGSTWRRILETNGATKAFTLYASGLIPIDVDTIKSIRGRQFRIVCATTQTADRTFEVFYEKLD